MTLFPTGRGTRAAGRPWAVRNFPTASQRCPLWQPIMLTALFPDPGFCL